MVKVEIVNGKFNVKKLFCNAFAFILSEKTCRMLLVEECRRISMEVQRFRIIAANPRPQTLRTCLTCYNSMATPKAP